MNWSQLLRALVVLSLLLGSSGAAATTVTAAKPAVQMSAVTVSPEDPNTGETVTIEATISNLQNSPSTVDVRDVYVRVPGTTREYARVEDLGSIAPGGSLTVPVVTSFENPGQKRLTLKVVVQDDAGDYHSYTYPVYVEVTEPTVRADLSAGVPESGSGTEVTLTNFGNTNLTDVEITATADGAIVERNFLFDVDPGTTQSSVFDTEDLDTETVRFTATYTAAGSSHATTLDVDLEDQSPVKGEIRLTAVEVTRSGTGVTIQGDAANLGSTDTQSVLVRIPRGDDVRPAPPSGEYFIGAIEGSEFATFELTAQVESGVTAVPVEISYIVDNERITTIQEVGLDAAAVTETDDQAANDGRGPPGSTTGLPLTAIGVGIAVLAAVGFGIYRWRR
ncbi:hypothetical protein DVK02_04065 [Halobellus sp. Atlit-31R]|nr:hypothetical protein DVK02_04065 [Halobellus sp. Atlit-31R]